MRRFEKELQIIEKAILNSFTIVDRTQRVQLFKKALQKGKELLYALHKQGASGREIVSRYTSFTDYILQAIFKTAEMGILKKEGPPSPEGVLIAVGGYGRGELNPQSDIDVLFVFEQALTPKTEQLVTECLYFLWDIGLDIGYSTRSIGECLHLAKEHLDSGTSMLESRFLAGQAPIYAHFRENIENFFQRQERRTFVAEKIVERDLRYNHYDNSIYVQEPNIKESAGGLRDLHFVRWLAKGLYNCDSLQELYNGGYCSLDEFKEVETAFDFLLRVRNELHFSSSMKKDQVTLEDQSKVAKALGYKSSSISLAPEKFMQDYYRHAKTINLFQQNFIEKYQIESRQGLNQPVLKTQLENKFVLVGNNFLELEGDDSRYQENPSCIMEIFLQQQRYKSFIGARLKGVIRSVLIGLDSTISRNPAFTDPFLELLHKRDNVVPVLRGMHELGLLGKLMPEFGKLTCFVQYDYNHRYTADEHTLRALENLEAIPKFNPREVPLGQIPLIYGDTEDMALLRLAILLHDVGKAMGPKHVENSVRVVPRVSRRLNLSSEDTEIVEFLVRNHLVLSYVAQLRDPDDEKTIGDFANTVANPQRLQLLYLLTFCDISAATPGLWTIWKSMLLEEVYQKTLDIISLEDYKTERFEYFNRIQEAVLNRCPSEIPLDEAKMHLNGMHKKYFYATAVDTVIKHLHLIHALQSSVVITQSQFIPELNCTDLTICTRDHLGLFAEIVGIISFHNLNIISAQIYTRDDGIAIDTFKIVDSIDDSMNQTVQKNLEDVFTNALNVDDLILQNSKFLSLKRRGKFPVATQIHFDNESSDQFTIVDIQAHDRIGLLYLVAKILFNSHVNIRFAKIFTEGDQALDVFYVHDREGKKISGEVALNEIKNNLTKALGNQSPDAKKGLKVSRLHRNTKKIEKL